MKNSFVYILSGKARRKCKYVQTLALYATKFVCKRPGGLVMRGGEERRKEEKTRRTGWRTGGLARRRAAMHQEILPSAGATLFLPC